MKSKFFLFLLANVALFSCKSEVKEAAAAAEVIEKQKFEQFTVTVDIKIKKDDDLIVYYKDGTNEWIVEDKAVWNTVKGSNEFQKVVFELPKDVVPNDFRFDIGRNEFKGQEPVEIRSIKLNYYNNEFEITQDMFATFLRPNQYVKYDEVTKQYSFAKDEKGYYDPYFEPTPAIYPQISKLVFNK